MDLSKTEVVKSTKRRENIEIYSFNATSIRGKLNQFNNFFSGHDFDVIAISETWLNEDVNDGEILDNVQYDIHRKDRDLTLFQKDDGGGVLCAVHSSFKSKRRQDLETPFELLWVEIVFNDRSIFVGTVYMPTKANATIINDFDNAIDNVMNVLKERDSLVILGDFNMPKIKWEFNASDSVEVVNSDNLCAITSRFLDVMNSHNLKQHNTHATHSEALLDLVFTDGLEANVQVSHKATTSTHLALEASIKINCKQKTLSTQRTCYNYKKADFEHILHLLMCMSWVNLDYFNSINKAFEYFYDILYAIIKDNIPVVNIKSRRYPHWYDTEIIIMLKEKEKYRKKFIKQGRNKTSFAYQQYSIQRANVKKMQRELYAHYLNKLGSEMKINPKRFWSFVKQKRSNGSLPKEMQHEGVVLKTVKVIATVFNSYFQSVFTPNCVVDNAIHQACPFRDVDVFRMPVITPETVLKCLKSLNLNTSTGSDHISATFIIKCADALCIPLAKLFNLSIDYGDYPLILKRNNIIPIFKKGDKSFIENYRGISLEPIIAKVFESIVNQALRNHINPYICEEQHGFMPMRSTVTNLACYAEFLTQSLDKKCQVHAIYTDFKQAFDTVPHNTLLLKMKRQFGISNNMLKWFESYLTDRYQRVVLSGIESDWVLATSGVPQGSILGPSLFIMFINDLSEVLKESNCLLFADDAKIFKTIKSIADCFLLQIDINNVVAWCNLWKIKINLSKCFYINFSLLRSRAVDYRYVMHGSIIEKVKQIKDLGVIFTPTLDFNIHICNVVSKVFKMFGFMKRILQPFSDVSVYFALYHTLIRSRLEYCSFIWSPSTKVMTDKIERVQKKFLKQCAYKCNIYNLNLTYSELCKNFNLQPLFQRRKMLDLRILNKILNNGVDCPYILSSVNFRVPTRITRNNHLFALDGRLNIRRNSPIQRASKLANEVDIDVVGISPIVLRRILKTHFSI